MQTFIHEHILCGYNCDLNVEILMEDCSAHKQLTAQDKLQHYSQILPIVDKHQSLQI